MCVHCACTNMCACTNVWACANVCALCVCAWMCVCECACVCPLKEPENPHLNSSKTSLRNRCQVTADVSEGSSGRRPLINIFRCCLRVMMGIYKESDFSSAKAFSEGCSASPHQSRPGKVARRMESQALPPGRELRPAPGPAVRAGASRKRFGRGRHEHLHLSFRGNFP